MLNLLQLSTGEDRETLVFSQDVDLSYIELWGFQPLAEPVRVTGTIRPQRTTEYLLEYTAEGTSVLPCARCLTEARRNFSLKFSHLLREVQQEMDDEAEDGYTPVFQGQLALTEMVATDLLLEELEDMPLCDPDCQGLCPVCGANHNETSCDCEIEEFKDPRFDALRELLDQ